MFSILKPLTIRFITLVGVLIAVLILLVVGIVLVATAKPKDEAAAQAPTAAVAS